MIQTMAFNSVYDALVRDEVKDCTRLQPGTHLRAGRTGYDHHGIYVGNHRVISYLNDTGVTQTSYETFAAGDPVYVVEHDDRRYSYDEIARRAEQRLGEDDYNVAFNNCEHFANWCVTGKEYSKQVREAVTTAAQVGAMAGAAVLAKTAPTVVRTAATVGTLAAQGASVAAGAGTVAGTASLITGSAALGGAAAAATGTGATVLGIVGTGAAATIAAPAVLATGGLLAVGYGLKKLFWDD